MDIPLDLKPDSQRFTDQLRIFIRTRTLGGGKSNVGDIFNSGLLLDEEHSTLVLLGEIGKTPETLYKSALIHRAKLLTDVNRLKTWGDNIIKIGVGLIAFVVIGGLLSLIFNIAMNQGAF